LSDPTRLAVLISGSGSNLQALIDACNQCEINARIAVVISNRENVAGLDRAAAAGIPTVTIDHRNFDSRDDFDRALLDAMAEHDPELIVLAGFMRILTPIFIHKFCGRLLNIHPSLLPKYPGMHTHQRALDAGDSEAGATVHFVTEELDGGPPILQVRVPIEATDDANSLARRVLAEEHKIYPLVVRWYCEGRLCLVENSVSLDGNVLPGTGLDYHP
jgi:phosphoribosylglycinamide formyltransferase-1